MDNFNHIAFINPPNVPFSSKGILIEPIDTLGLATFVQSLGFRVSFIDMDVRKMLAPSLINIFKENWPKIIVIVFDYHIPLHNAGANQAISHICDLAKRNGSTVILGGKAATFYEEEQLKALGANIFIKHDMEVPLQQILQAYKQSPYHWMNELKNIHNIRYFLNHYNAKQSKCLKEFIDNEDDLDGTIRDNNDSELYNSVNHNDMKFFDNSMVVSNITDTVKNNISSQTLPINFTPYLFEKDSSTLSSQLTLKININDLPIPDRKIAHLENYIDVRTMLSSRGCNLKCTFCHVPGFWGNWKGRSVDSVVEEIRILVENHHSKKILFLDDNAMAQPKRLASISKKLQEKNILVAMGCLGTISSYQPDVISSMYDGGFRWIHYGAESGDAQQLKTMGKKIQPEQILQAVQGTQERGLRVRTSWILDMPELTEEGLLLNEQMILNHQADEIRLHFLTLRLGSILFDQYSLETPQFIHNSQPNLNISQVSDDLINASLQRILQGLKEQGYTLVINPDDFIDIDALTEINPKLKIVSLCPLRYGLGWKL